MVDFKSGTLLYRATRDGFYSSAFHAKCDGIPNTVTLIKTDLNGVFGGFASSKWDSSGFYIADSRAFIFSLRKNGKLRNDKFMIKPEHASMALIGNRDNGPIFAGYSSCDIFIKNNSNVNRGSFTNIGGSYQLPTYLAGSKNNWLSTEIEVYELF